MNMIFRWVLLLGFVSVISACAGEMSDAEHVEKAQENLSKGELKPAVIELKNALGRNPQNPEARFLLGKIYLKLGSAPAAEKELLRARELGADDNKVLPILGRALFTQGKGEDLLALPLDKLDDSNRADVLTTQGLMKLALREVEGASTLISRALEKNPKSPYAQVAKARLLAVNGELEQARAQLASVFEIDPDYPLAWSFFGDLEQQAQKLESAEEAYTKAVRNKEYYKFGDYLKRAMLRIRLRKYEKAQADLNPLKKRSPLHPGVNYALGLVALDRKELKEAQAAFEIAYMDKERYPLALYLLSVTNYLQRNMQQAETYAANYVAQNPEFIPAYKILAAIKLRKGEYAEVEELLRPVIERDREDALLLNLFTTALLKQGKTEEGIGLLEKMAETQPESADAQMRLGAGLLMAGDQGPAMERIEAAIQLDPQYQQADMLLVLNYLGQQKYEEALKAAERYRDRQPKTAEPLNLLGQIYLATNKEEKAREAFSQARALEPGNPSANHALADMALREGKHDDVRRYYNEVLNHHKDYLPTLLRLAALSISEKNEQAAEKHLQQAISVYPGAVQPRLILAEQYLLQGRPEQVSILFDELEDAQKAAPAVLNIIGMAQLEQKVFPQARATLEQLVKSQPDSAQAHYLLARAYAGLGERKKMESELETALKLAPRHFPAHLALAHSLVDQQREDDAKRHLEVLKEIDPDQLEVLQLEVALARREQNHEKTLDLLERIYQQSPSTSSTLDLARQRWGMGDKKGAIELQETWINSHPDDIPARMALANIYAQESNVDAAVEQYKNILERDEKNLIALNDLAWYLRDSKPKEALEYAQRANEIKPDTATLMDTLAVVLLKNGEAKKAQRLMDKVMLKAPKDPTTRYHSAMIDVANGDNDKAQVTLIALLRDGKDFPEKQSASELLDKLRSGK